jgi:subtilisin family serine protease
MIQWKIKWKIFFCILMTRTVCGFCQDDSLFYKMDPLIRKILRSQGNPVDFKSVHLLRDRDGQIAVGCFIQTSYFKTLSENGVSIRARADNICTTAIPLLQLANVAKLPSVEYIEAGIVCKPKLDKSVPEIDVDRVWNGELGSVFDGEGVLIGIYDSGIDWSHPDFIDSTGNSRIRFLWDQTVNDGPHPQDEGFNYGTEYTNAQLNNAIYVSGYGIEGLDITGHGTHVAGIAAGNGRGAKNGKPCNVYIGVAPGAELVIVKGGDMQFFSDDIFDGIKYMFQKAAEFDPPRPCVVNLSVGGTQKGPHNGTSLFEKGIDQLIDWQKGRAVVIAAGNDGKKNIHFSGAFDAGVETDTILVEFQVKDNRVGYQDYVSFDIWYYSFADLFSITVQTPSGESYGPVESSQSMSWNTAEGTISLDNASTSHEFDKELTIDLFDSMNESVLNDNLTTGTWKLLFIGMAGQCNGWLYNTSIEAEISSQADMSILVAEPGNCNLGITVGSYITRLNWPSLLPKTWLQNASQVGDLSEFSSPGPTRDGRNKPDITAPGEFILAALSEQLDISDRNYLVADDSMHWAIRGTSMAAPHVTGVIALMLQADPELDASQLVSRLIVSARQDDYTGQTWNPNWGFGKLDAYHAVKTITSVHERDQDHHDTFSIFQNFPNPFNDNTVITYTIRENSSEIPENIRIDIYDIRGNLVSNVYHGRQQPGYYRVTWNGRDDSGNRVASGVYLYRIVCGSLVFCRKMAFIQ